MISVIVPVYNVEPYLKVCLDSILAQTYEDLEILIVDDGSNDGSSDICDEYRKDGRVEVFHTENRGLSCARNLGLEKAKGEYISFVDSDDWIDNNALQTLLRYAVDNNADIVSSAFYLEWKDHRKIEEEIKKPILLEGEHIIQAYIKEPYLGTAIWNKLYKRDVYSGVRFPEGRVFEDFLTTYKLLANTKKAVCIPDVLFHYRMRDKTISRTYTMASMIAYWQAHRERYYALLKTNPECLEVLVMDCFGAIGRMCRWYSSYTETEKNSAESVMVEMQEFSKKHYFMVMRNDCFSLNMKIICICAKTRSNVLFRLLNILTRAYTFGKRRRLYSY